jgi:hypothetical protein
MPAGRVQSPAHIEQVHVMVDVRGGAMAGEGGRDRSHWFGTGAVLLLAVMTLLSGCGTRAPEEPAPRSTATDDGPANSGWNNGPANVVLWVSNQSFVDESVRITVLIDDRTVVDQVFAVKGQHNWIKFPFHVVPGTRTLTISSDTGARKAGQVQVRQRGTRFAVIDYWCDSGAQDRRFTLQTSDQPFVFD